jgi:hypothetical protein
MPTEPALTPERAELLRACGSLVVPPEDGAPGFTEADADGQMLAAATVYAGQRLAQIAAAIESMPGSDLSERLNAFSREQPALFKHLREILVCCYLSTSKVWELVGYTGRKPRSPTPGEADEWLGSEILDPVRRRGPIYKSPAQNSGG